MVNITDTIFPLAVNDEADLAENHSLNFTHLPGYALFLLQNKIPEIVRTQLKLFRKLNVPVFKYFSDLPEKELEDRGASSTGIFLQAFADNKAANYINQQLTGWVNNQLPLISRNNIKAEDITLISYIRRSVLRTYLPWYTTDLEMIIKILQEIDTYTTEFDTRSFKILFSIQEELHTETKELAQLGNWIWDLKKNVITWSDEIFNIYQLDPQNIAPENLVTYNHPDDAAMVQDQMAISRQTLHPHDFYYRILLPGGGQKTLHAKGRVLADENGEAYRMFGTLQDVTKEKEMEMQVMENQMIIQKIADLTPSMIAAYNINTGKYMFINQAINSLLGYTREEVLEKGTAFFVPIIHPDDVQPLLEKNALAISEANRLKMSSDKEFIVEFLYRIKHANGGYRWMQTFGTIFNRNKNGKVEDVINISIDVTDQVNISDELKAKHRELEETNSKLAHKNKELEAFTYIASHDLQEPLRKIKFFVQQIQDGQTTTTGSNYNARVSSEVSRMQHMINGLLEYSQMTKEDNAPFEQIGLGALLAEIKNGMADELNEKQAIIQISQLPVLRGIRLQLYQLFSNLIHNSLKYSRTGVAPTIHIYSEIVEMPGKLPNASSFIKITHADNGIGFENEYAEYIFELFRRLHSKNAYSGTGIGLTICKRILENHSGFIEATGIPDQGATFNMYFPVD